MHKKAAKLILVVVVLAQLLGCDIALNTTGEDQESQAPYETIAYLYAQETLEIENAAKTVSALQTTPSTAEPKSLEEKPIEGGDTPIPSGDTFTPSPTFTGTSTYTIAPSSTSQAVYSQPSSTSTSTSTQTATMTLTPTVSSTATAVNTPVIGIPCDNGKARYLVAYMATPPAIDGSIRYWTSFVYGVPNLIYGDKSWAGAYDLSATFQTGYNAQYFFMAVNVQDERYIQNVDDGYHMYDGDSLEIVFDADLCGDFNDSSMSADDYQIGITPGYVSVNGDKYAFRWFPRPSGRMNDVVVASVRGPGDVTIYELAIPWSALGVSSPAAGQAYGFTLSVSDNDNGKENLQESLISSTYRTFNPKSWGTIILQ
jgi:hypothetical protein